MWSAFNNVSEEDRKLILSVIHCTGTKWSIICTNEKWYWMVFSYFKKTHCSCSIVSAFRQGVVRCWWCLCCHGDTCVTMVSHFTMVTHPRHCRKGSVRRCTILLAAGFDKQHPWLKLAFGSFGTTRMTNQTVYSSSKCRNCWHKLYGANKINLYSKMPHK